MDTAPDLSIVHSSLIEKFSWDTIDDTGSDHKPILITYREGFEIPKVKNTTRYKWKLAKGDWENVSDRDKTNQFAKTYKSFSLLETRKSDRVIRKEV